MPREKKKYEHGAVNAYTSRSQALKKLQLSLKNFSRLCILKGIHPHEPRHQKQLNKGGSQKKIWYYTKDIQYLAHEPLIAKFREQTVFLHKMRAAKQLRDKHKQEVISQWEPQYELARIIRERYPSLVDALRDMSDALSVLFTYAELPAEYGTGQVSPQVVRTCRRLSNEWMHYCIASKALTKTFVSLKGIYYQANVQGSLITWIVPHKRATNLVAVDVDYAVMSTFVEYYQSLVGFVNSTLFRKLGAVYPLEVETKTDVEDKEAAVESVLSLTRPVRMAVPTTQQSDTAPIDAFDEDDEDEDQDLRAARRQQKLDAKLPTLFKGLFFFLNVETPQESLAFVIRSCGGTVSSQGVYGQTFELSDPRVTHQISERPKTAPSLRHSIVQPQWVYDSVNARALLATHKYIPGSAALPPHYSPFVSERVGDYVTEERLAAQEDSAMAAKMTGAMEDISNMNGQLPKATKTVVEPVRKSKTRHKQQQALNEAGEQRKLQEMMIAKKHKRVYAKLVGGEKKKKRGVRKLIEKKQKLVEA